MRSLVAAVLLTAACGSKSPSTTMPAGGAGGHEGAAVVLPDVPFEQLDDTQRAEFMKQKVLPEMKQIFQKHDADDFAGFGCQTCHGDEVKDGHFDMPNPKLPKLNLADLGKFKKADVEWMQKEVAPTMSRILNIPLASKDNPRGFGCPSCHPIEGT